MDLHYDERKEGMYWSEITIRNKSKEKWDFEVFREFDDKGK